MHAVFLTVLLLAGLVCAPCAAQAPPPFPEFEAKRVTPPARNAPGQKITVQIDPSAVVAPPIAQPDDLALAPSGPPAAPFEWFWDKVSRDAAAASAGRIETAMLALEGAKAKVPAPRLQDVARLAQAYGIEILVNTVGTTVSPALVLAVISVESSGRTDAVSDAGAQGLMQLMPATAVRFGVEDPNEPSQNIAGGVKYLDFLMQSFDEDPILALAGYNAGEGAVAKHSGVPPFAETLAYVPKVLAAFQVAKGLCQTPPQLASDGCVFATLN